MDISVRLYEDNDLDNVNYCLKEAFNFKKSNFKSDNYFEVVGCIDGKAVGYLLVTKVFNPVEDKLYFLVDDVCVNSKYRGLGICDKMMEYVYNIAKNNNIKYIQLTCNPTRVMAREVYKRCGYIKYNTDIFRKEII